MNIDRVLADQVVAGMDKVDVMCAFGDACFSGKLGGDKWDFDYNGTKLTVTSKEWKALINDCNERFPKLDPRLDEEDDKDEIEPILGITKEGITYKFLSETIKAIEDCDMDVPNIALSILVHIDP